MQNLRKLDRYRVTYLGSLGNDTNGKFIIPTKGAIYQVIASTELGWDHVSVSVIKPNNYQLRIANFEELEMIRSMFFCKDETVIEFHPRKQDYVNQNEYVLHLWRPNQEILPIPPVMSNFVPYDYIYLPNTNIQLEIKYSKEEAWDCYEVQVIKKGKRVKRYPSWDEMYEAKKQICGEDSLALQYHTEYGISGYQIRLFVPPKELSFPVPDPLMVGFRNQDDIKRLFKIIFK